MIRLRSVTGPSRASCERIDGGHRLDSVLVVGAGIGGGHRLDSVLVAGAEVSDRHRLDSVLVVGAGIGGRHGSAQSCSSGNSRAGKPPREIGPQRSTATRMSDLPWAAMVERYSSQSSWWPRMLR